MLLVVDPKMILSMLLPRQSFEQRQTNGKNGWKMQKCF